MKSDQTLAGAHGDKLSHDAVADLFNFRDFGGAVLRDAAAVVTDRLYRSGSHAGLSPAAARRLMMYDFALIIDLRYPDERIKEASPWPMSWAERMLAHDVEGGKDAPHLTLLHSAFQGVTAVHRAYEELYRALPFDPVYHALFVEAFSRLADIEGRTLIHCSAGKDRTGMLVALLLDVLGVSRAAIFADYMVSADAAALRRVAAEVADRLTANGVDDADMVAEELAGVSPDYLAAMFAAIEEFHGSVPAYLQAGGLPGDAVVRLRERFIARQAVAHPDQNG